MSNPPRPVFIDTDLALGARSGDVDDGFALAAVLRAPGLRLLGVSTVFGNSDSATSARCARALLDAAGANVDVVAGAERAGEATAAARAIAALPAGTALLALGPLTNVATALADNPPLCRRITVHLVGGNLSSRGRWPPYWPFEFNLAKDPAAARAVFESPVARRVYPLDACAGLRIGGRALWRLSRASSLGAYLARGSLRWLAYAPLRYRSLEFPLWDLVPALDLAGLLGPVEESRRLRLEGRGLLVEDPTARESACVRSFSAAPALAAFEALLA